MPCLTKNIDKTLTENHNVGFKDFLIATARLSNPNQQIKELLAFGKTHNKEINTLTKNHNVGFKDLLISITCSSNPSQQIKELLIFGNQKENIDIINKCNTTLKKLLIKAIYAFNTTKFITNYLNNPITNNNNIDNNNANEIELSEENNDARENESNDDVNEIDLSEGNDDARENESNYYNNNWSNANNYDMGHDEVDKVSLSKFYD